MILNAILRIRKRKWSDNKGIVAFVFVVGHKSELASCLTLEFNELAFLLGV